MYKIKKNFNKKKFCFKNRVNKEDGKSNKNI